MLKGAAKTAYMREYMRRRRAAGQAAAAMIDALRRELAAAKARIRELEVRGKQPEAGAVAEDEIAALRRRITEVEQERDTAALVALCSVMSLVDRHMADRATREGTLAEAVA